MFCNSSSHRHVSHQVAYQDAAPFMLLSEASLADVNTKLPDGIKEVGMEQFRPNLVATGCSAFDEVCIHMLVLSVKVLSMEYVVTFCVGVFSVEYVGVFPWNILVLFM